MTVKYRHAIRTVMVQYHNGRSTVTVQYHDVTVLSGKKHHDGTVENQLATFVQSISYRIHFVASC